VVTEIHVLLLPMHILRRPQPVEMVEVKCDASLAACNAIVQENRDQSLPSMHCIRKLVYVVFYT